MTVYGIAGEQLLTDQERSARIALAGMPVRMILREPALLRDLRRLGLQFLQAHHVRPLAPQPLPHLGRAGPDAVDIPGGDFHAARARRITFEAREPFLPRLDGGPPRAHRTRG